MPTIAGRRRSQPPPPHVVYEAIIDPDRDPTRPWLLLRDGEQRPAVIDAVEPNLVVWSSLWPWRPDARIRFDLTGGRSGTTLHWTLIVDDPVPDDETTVRMRKRINELINANLRFTFGQ
ncbi:hypothetical protein [Rhodococcus sp. BUPNP1]|uniref:hypothetical protein n=1 Tax=Rhodococcus sp. BUPNP1 TaxID=1432786 RepID=UPI001554F1F5|nr:hypothetical protein [Rhodococcus sp. BUPNP1]